MSEEFKEQIFAAEITDPAMRNQTTTQGTVIDVGIALLHPDGSVTIPRTGKVESSLFGLPFDGGTFDVEPGYLVVQYEDGRWFDLAYDHGRWTEKGQSGLPWDVTKKLAGFAAALVTASAFAAVVALWFFYSAGQER